MPRHPHTVQTPSTPSTMLKRPSKSILKTPSAIAGLKRKNFEVNLPSETPSIATSYSDSNDSGETTATPFSSASSPPRKKSRVKFDCDEMESRAEVDGSTQTSTPKNRYSSSPPEKSLALVREEVRRAVQQYEIGNGEQYDRIKAMFLADPKQVDDDGSLVFDLPSHTSLLNHVLGMQANISLFNPSCSGLVHAVIESEWVGRDKAYVEIFVRFLSTLCAAKGGFLTTVLRMLIDGLREVDPRVGNLPGYEPVRDPQVHYRMHYAIQQVARLVPSCSAAASSLLSTCFPHDSDTVKSNYIYVKNLIKMVDYFPELRSDVAGVVTEKLVKIDARNQMHLEDLDEQTQQEIQSSIDMAEIPSFEEDGGSDDGHIAVSENESVSEDEKRKSHLIDCYQKIDYIIDLIFEFYSPPFELGSLEEQEKAIDLLLAHFEQIILPTYRSRHSQFLVFHFVQTSPVFIDRFATLCIEIILNKSQPTILRQHTCAYLASFVSRGERVSGEVVRDVFGLLGSYIMELFSEYNKTCRGPDLRRYGIFYAAAQAIFYIFCFRWKDLTIAAAEAEAEGRVLEDIDVDDVAFAPEMKDMLSTVIYSNLNPLKICSPEVVLEFARVARHFSFMYVHPLIQTNKSLRIHSHRGLKSTAMDTVFGSMERETRADDNMGSQLDGIFPFDPYTLPRSARWVQEDYRVYTRCVNDRDEDDDDDDTPSEDEYDEEAIDINTETGSDED
ncbi:hypothetical protein FQN57_007026 [Myotisia sp. PD_48]|nr:hypothetical protein FQN57_007026 [Myotisia sp. PD_48]